MATTATDKFGGVIGSSATQRFTGELVGGNYLSGLYRPGYFALGFFAADFFRGDTEATAAPLGGTNTGRFNGTITGNVTQRYTGTLS